MSHATEHVRFQVGDRWPVEISWKAGQELQARCLQVPSAHPIVEKMWAVGVSRPVELDDPDMGALLDVIWLWIRDVGTAQLPAGVLELGDALRDELDDERRWVRPAKGRGSGPATTCTEPAKFAHCAPARD